MLDRLIVLPVIIVVILTMMCFVQALASPRVFRSPVRRFIAATLFFVYFVMALSEASLFGGEALYVNADKVIRWFIQIIPLAMCFWMMKKLEDARPEIPLKHDSLKGVIKASQPT